MVSFVVFVSVRTLGRFYLNPYPKKNFLINRSQHPVKILLTYLCSDCKAYRWSHKTRKVCDITEGNRTKICDATDPGGRIGPYLDEGTPDLRNIDLYFEVFEEGDLILLLTDGVHGTKSKLSIMINCV